MKKVFQVLCLLAWIDFVSVASHRPIAASGCLVMPIRKRLCPPNRCFLGWVTPSSTFTSLRKCHDLTDIYKVRNGVHNPFLMEITLEQIMAIWVDPTLHYLVRKNASVKFSLTLSFKMGCSYGREPNSMVRL